MRYLSALRLIAILLAITTLFTGCSRDPSVRKQKYFESGQRYFEKGKYREAAIQFGNAVQVDSRFAEAHYQLAQTYLKLQDPMHAYQELTRTLELQPENYKAQIDISNMFILGHDLNQAKEHIDLLLQKDAQDPQVHETAANLLHAQGDLNGALQEMQKAVALAPDHWEAYAGLANLQIALNQPAAAEINLRKAIELSPKDVGAQLALANFYESQHRFSNAETQFRRAIEVDPKYPEARAELARLYLAQGKNSEAEEFLKNSKRDFPDVSAGYRMLGDFYFATAQLDKAVAEYSILFQDHPKDPEVKKNYIQLLILKNRLDEAQKLNDEVLKTNANDEAALIYRGQIQIRQGKASEAVQVLQKDLRNNPDNGIAHYQLGIAFNQTGDLQRAQGEWQNAVRLRPDLVEAYRALASVALRNHDMPALEQTATEIINRDPTSPDGYCLRAASTMNRKQFDRAAEDVRKAIEVAPQSPMGYIQLGNLQSVQNHFAEAEKSYLQALDRDASSADALAGLMNAYFTDKQPDKAVAAANAQIAKAGDNTAFYDLLGTALFNEKKDLKGAEAALQKSAELDKNNGDALLKLGQVQVAEGSADAAIATYQNAVKNNPKEPSFYILTGELYEAKQDWDKAKQSYKKALEISPENPIASNNLAYVMLQTGGNVDVALSLAQTARRADPDNANTADTLGWIFYQKGAYSSAIELFQEALKLAEKQKGADNPTVHYHLGLAYQKIDKPALAREQLQRVLKINPNYSDAADVKKQLAQLSS
ncbi:MAG: Tetratricopeptide 1 repeat-containing protein [Acidobacteriaceae bacterium]|nr:Tetratricopeptide 1 repeat-containing protein [Acidobacteriaceae bacterium]